MKQQHLRWLIPAATTVSLSAACGPSETPGPVSSGTGSTSGTGASSTGASSTGGGNTGGGNTGGTAATGGTGGTGGFATGGGGAAVDPGLVQALALACASEFECGTYVTEYYASPADCLAGSVARFAGDPYASDPACGAAMLAMAECYDVESSCQVAFDENGVPYNELYAPTDACYYEYGLAFDSCN